MSTHTPKVACLIHRRSARAWIVLSIVSAVAGASINGARPAAALGPNDRRLTNARSGISVEAPAGWTLSQHTGYTDTIVFVLHPDGSRISVSATATALKSADALYKQNSPGLVAQGLIATTVGAGARGSLAVDLSAAGRPDRMRQLYLVRDVPNGHQAIVLTLVSSRKAFSERLSALDSVATRLTLDDPLPTPTSAPSSSRSGAAGTTGSTVR